MTTHSLYCNDPWGTIRRLSMQPGLIQRRRGNPTNWIYIYISFYLNDPTFGCPDFPRYQHSAVLQLHATGAHGQAGRQWRRSVRWATGRPHGVHDLRKGVAVILSRLWLEAHPFLARSLERYLKYPRHCNFFFAGICEVNVVRVFYISFTRALFGVGSRWWGLSEMLHLSTCRSGMRFLNINVVFPCGIFFNWPWGNLLTVPDNAPGNKISNNRDDPSTIKNSINIFWNKHQSAIISFIHRCAKRLYLYPLMLLN